MSEIKWMSVTVVDKIALNQMSEMMRNAILSNGSDEARCSECHGLLGKDEPLGLQSSIGFVDGGVVGFAVTLICVLCVAEKNRMVFAFPDERIDKQF